MPASQNKIITKLRERRRIESDLRRMRAASSSLDLRRQAREIAALGSEVIPAIISNLSQADGEMVAAMGTVATLLDREEVVGALQRAVRHPEQSVRGRRAGLMILERFLGEPVDADLMVSLVDAESEALSSLETVLSRAERQPSILVDFVQELDQQEPDVVLAVVHALREANGPRVVEPLRMMAQDVREEIAVEALRALGSVRKPEAVQALQTLVPTVAPGLVPLAERLLRKMMFVGVEVQALPQPQSAWRALVSPVDGRGQQRVWFLQQSQEALDVRFLNVLLSDLAGVVEAVGHDRVSALVLPPRRPLGTMHDIALPGGSAVMLMLEASFDLGRRLVLEALPTNRETQIPVPGALRLLGPWLWASGGADSLPSQCLTALGSADASRLPDSDHLLRHPAFSAWTFHGRSILEAVGQASQQSGWNMEGWIKRLSGSLFSGPDAAHVLSRRLESMSEWLLLAGDEALSCLALRSAQEILADGAQEHPFVLAWVRRELELATETHS